MLAAIVVGNDLIELLVVVVLLLLAVMLALAIIRL